MERAGAAAGSGRGRGGRRGPGDDRRQLLPARRHVLLHRRALRPSGRRQARARTQGARVPARGPAAAPSERGVRGGALRGHDAARAVHEGAGCCRTRPDGRRVRRHGQLQGDERAVRRARVRGARDGTRWPSTAPARASRSACAGSAPATTTRYPAPPPTSTWPRGPTWTPPASSSWATVSAATTPPASPPSSLATRPAWRSPPCTGTWPAGSARCSAATSAIRAPPPSRPSTSPGSWAVPT